MSITGINALIALPPDFYLGGNITFQGTFYLNGTNPQRFAFIFQAPETGNIDLVEMYIGFVSGANDIRISIQDVDASGLPDGTDDAYKVSSKATGWQSYALTSTGAGGGSKKAVTRGSFYAIVGKWESTQSGGFEPHQLHTAGNLDMLGGTYCLSHNGSSWSKTVGQTVYPNLAIKYDDGSYYPIINALPATAFSAEAYASNSTPDERGLYFIPQIPIRVRGFWLEGVLGNNLDVVLYDSSNNVLATYTHDPDYSSSATRYARFLFSSSVDLTAAATYRLVLKPTSTSNVSLYVATANSAALIGMWPMGANWHYTARTDAGSWSQTTTKRPLIGPLVDGFDLGGTINTYRALIGGGFGQRGVGVS